MAFISLFSKSTSDVNASSRVETFADKQTKVAGIRTAFAHAVQKLATKFTNYNNAHYKLTSPSLASFQNQPINEFLRLVPDHNHQAKVTTITHGENAQTVQLSQGGLTYSVGPHGHNIIGTVPQLQGPQHFASRATNDQGLQTSNQSHFIPELNQMVVTEIKTKDHQGNEETSKYRYVPELHKMEMFDNLKSSRGTIIHTNFEFNKKAKIWGPTIQLTYRENHPTEEVDFQHNPTTNTMLPSRCTIQLADKGTVTHWFNYHSQLNDVIKTKSSYSNSATGHLDITEFAHNEKGELDTVTTYGTLTKGVTVLKFGPIRGTNMRGELSSKTEHDNWDVSFNTYDYIPELGSRQVVLSHTQHTNGQRSNQEYSYIPELKSMAMTYGTALTPDDGAMSTGTWEYQPSTQKMGLANGIKAFPNGQLIKGLWLHSNETNSINFLQATHSNKEQLTEYGHWKQMPHFNNGVYLSEGARTQSGNKQNGHFELVPQMAPSNNTQLVNGKIEFSNGSTAEGEFKYCSTLKNMQLAHGSFKKGEITEKGKFDYVERFQAWQLVDGSRTTNAGTETGKWAFNPNKGQMVRANGDFESAERKTKETGTLSYFEQVQDMRLAGDNCLRTDNEGNRFEGTFAWVNGLSEKTQDTHLIKGKAI